MRLTRQTALLLATLVTIGCRDSVSPPSPAVAGLYMLQAVNGEQLPAIIYSTSTETITVIFAWLTLGPDGSADLVERRRDVDHGNTTESTYTFAFKYKVNGNKITIGSFTPCPANADCVGAFVGNISGSTISLNFGLSTAPLVYVYQRSSIVD